MKQCPFGLELHVCSCVTISSTSSLKAVKVKGGVDEVPELKVMSLLMSDENLERVYHLCQRYAFVSSPLLDILHTVNKDDEVVFPALEVNFGLGSFSARHDDLKYVVD